MSKSAEEIAQIEDELESVNPLSKEAQRCRYILEREKDSAVLSPIARLGTAVGRIYKFSAALIACPHHDDIVEPAIRILEAAVGQLDRLLVGGGEQG